MLLLNLCCLSWLKHQLKSLTTFVYLNIYKKMVSPTWVLPSWKCSKPLKGIVMLCESSSLATKVDTKATKVDTKMVLVFFFLFFVLVWTVTLTYKLWFDIVKNKNITFMLGRSAVLSSANKRFTWMYLSNWALRHELPHPISEAAPFPGTMLNEH